MADDEGRALDGEQLTFLAGWIALAAARSALRQRRATKAATPSLLGLIHRIRTGQVATLDGFPALADGPNDPTYEDLLRRFDASRKESNRYFRLGRAVLSARTTIGGLATAGLVLLAQHYRRPSSWSFRRVRIADRGSAGSRSVGEIQQLPSRAGGPSRSGGRSAPPGKHKVGRSKPASASALDLLEPWEAPTGAPARGTGSSVARPEADAASVRAFVIDEDLADDAPPTQKSQDWSLKSHRTGVALSNVAVEWLSGLGSANSGVRIEAYAEGLIRRLSRDDLAEVLASMRQGGEAGVAALWSGLQGKRLRADEALYLRRLSSVFDAVRDGYPLPPRRNGPEYEPVADSLLYLIHMRDPYETNGYVSRTHLVLTAMQSVGMRPTAVTRLGFPNDLARHRTAKVEREALMDGVSVLALPDELNGQIGRPVTKYIDAYAARIVDLARERRPAVIHAASNHLNGLAAIKASRIVGVPCVYEVRGIWEITQASTNEAYARTLRYEMQRRLENEAIAGADRVVTISEPLRRFVVEHGAEPNRVDVVPNGVDAQMMRPMPRQSMIAASFGIDPDDVVIGYVGSVVRYEGLDYVVEAVGHLKRAGLRQFKFLLVGDGRELASLKAQAERLGVLGECIFPGRVPHDQVEALYSVIDIVPLPRRSLPVTELVPPLKPFEAMAAGKAVIVSSVEAIAGTVVHGETGLIVEKDNVAALTEALESLIVDPERRRSMGRQAREWVEKNRSVPALAERLAGTYRAVGAISR